MNISELLVSLKDPSTTLTLLEKLVAGVSVALLSMGVVFIVLVFITIIIKLLQREKPVQNINNNVKEEIINIDEDNKENMDELVAVISGAIAVATGNSLNNIVVRKISRTNNSKTNWERLTKTKY